MAFFFVALPAALAAAGTSIILHIGLDHLNGLPQERDGFVVQTELVDRLPLKYQGSLQEILKGVTIGHSRCS